MKEPFIDVFLNFPTLRVASNINRGLTSDFDSTLSSQKSIMVAETIGLTSIDLFNSYQGVVYGTLIVKSILHKFRTRNEMRFFPRSYACTLLSRIKSSFVTTEIIDVRRYRFILFFY